MFSYLDFRCYFKKVMLKLTSISPRDLGESLRRRRRRSAFIYHTFHQSIFYSPYFIPSPQSVVRSRCFILTAINSFIHITYQGRNQNFSRGTHNFPNLSSPLSLYNNVIMLYTSTLLLFTRFYARFFTDIRVLKEKVCCFEKIYFRETNRVR